MIVSDFVLRDWGAWAPGLSSPDDWRAWSAGQKSMTTEPPVAPASVPKMLQRRLSQLAKAVFHAADRCIKAGEQVPTVFSSTHGEIGKSFQMLKTIGGGEELSPTAFSLGVHNAISGLFSIVYGNRQEITVLAPGREGVAAAFIEAAGMLHEGRDEVLLVLYDEVLPDFFPFAPFRLNVDAPCALALKIAASGPGLALRFCRSPEARDDGEQPVQLLALAKFLASDQESLTLGNLGHSWSWHKR
ncbi:MAG: beta-ketoacyl synthase chain length factor [Methylobacter sp.]|uniref:beta-ketoacyl synthase chain length factor n=1 Tax=Methylobacter sp. TaxID=2051955 RepID=UPI00258BAD07|nr:beta-ketoacyl synthase chain length factor [Methylobacter sp.]MCL7422803.1 beta-ketoacyl synthase chain length factor [Methylobacter sp.]